MISLHMVVCMACLYHQGVAGYAVQFRFEKWAQDHRLSPGLSVDLECIIEGDDLGEVKNESVPVVITRTAHEITDATPPPPTNGNTNQETTQNVSSGLIVDPLFSQMASPPYTITKNDSAANMIMYTLSIPSLHLADSATWNCMVGDVIRPLTMEVGEAPSKVEIFFVTEVSTVPMGPAGSASPATAINGTFPLNASITVNDTGINLAFLAESSSNDSAGGGILAAQGNASVPSGEQGANGTGGMSPNDTSASGNDTGSTPRVLVSVPMTTDVSGVLKDGVAKITSEISTRIGCRVTGGNPQSKTEIYIGDAPTFPSSTMASFTWDTTTPGFRFPRFEHETIVEMEFSWVHDEKMFSCNAMTGTDRPDLNTNDSVKLDVKGRPAFIEDNCESIIIDVTSPPEFFTCSIYCHPACQFVRVSDAGGSLFDLEVSLSVLSDSNKDVEATLNIDDSFQFVNAYGSANSLKVWTVKVKVPQEERFLTEYNFVARNAYGDNNQLIRMQMPSTPRPGDGAGEETTPKKADGGRAGGGGPGAGPPATEPGASWSGDKTKDADASSGGNMILIIGVVVSLLVVGGIVAAIMLTKKKPEPQPSAAVARPTRPSATKMEDVHVDMDKGAAPPVAEEAGEGGEVEEKPEGEAPKEEEGETPAAEGEGEAAHEGEAAPETAPEATPEGEAEPAAEAPPAEEAPPPEET